MHGGTASKLSELFRILGGTLNALILSTHYRWTVTFIMRPRSSVL